MWERGGEIFGFLIEVKEVNFLSEILKNDLIFDAIWWNPKLLFRNMFTKKGLVFHAVSLEMEMDSSKNIILSFTPFI